MAAVRTGLIAFIAIIGVAFAWLAFEWSRSDTGEEPFGVAFNLVDQTGAPVTEAAFREKPTALFFGFTHCPDVCPTTLFEMDGWLRQVDPDGDLINAYFVTVDPERDSPDLLENYVSAVTDRVIGITGEPEKVFDMARGFRIYFKKVPLEDSVDGDYVVDHYASIMLLNNGGRFKGTIAYGENPDIAVQKLENLIKG